jgi:hypothetical protein
MSKLLHERFFSLKDQQINEPEQKSEEWFKRRIGKLSSSKFSQFLFIKHFDEVKKFYGQVWEGLPRDEFTPEQSKWVEWGVEHEDTAMESLLNNVPALVAYEAPMIVHKGLNYLSSSPDGFYQLLGDDFEILDEGVIEIKCGGKTKKAYDKPKFYYIPQCYLHMACSGKRSTLFVSWGLDYTRAWRLEWNDKFWKILCDMIYAFRRVKSNLTWDEFQIHQMHLRRVCDEEAVRAEKIHPEKGWVCASE